MKRTIGFLLISLCCLNGLGFFMYFIIEIESIHEVMKERLATADKESLTRLSFSHTAIQETWLQDMELHWNGSYYDIKEVVSTGDSVIIYCLADDEENRFLDLLDNYFKGRNGRAHRMQHGMLHHLLFPFIVLDKLLLNHPISSVLKVAFSYTRFCSAPSLPIETPPPLMAA